MNAHYGRTISKRDIEIDKKQRALLHIAKKELGLDGDIYKQILLIYSGVESSALMKLDGFERVMEHFKRLGFESSAAKKYGQSRSKAPNRDPDGAPYPAQLSMIEGLFHQLGWDDTERQRGFCQRVIKKPWPQTRSEANKVFEGVKAMLARQRKE
ncbi:MAG: DUF1018 domain-containing protein [Negativicutes bacterium]|nr:DUF1018 domain-containing protein [Negativicutes bacterium]